MVPVELVRDVVERSGTPLDVVAMALGWEKQGLPDVTRLKRRLGLLAAPCSKGYGTKAQTHMQEATALLIIDAAGMDPVDIGL